VITKHDRRYKDGRPHEAVETDSIDRIAFGFLSARAGVQDIELARIS
jgi:hypothetical protein